MFNVGLGEVLVIVLVCLLVFGPERLPDVARKAGRALGQLRLAAQDALDQVKQDANLQDVDLPDLRVESLRAQAGDYLGRLLDIDRQMAELQRTKGTITAKLAEGDQPEAEPGTTPQAQDPGAAPIDPEAT